MRLESCWEHQPVARLVERVWGCEQPLFTSLRPHPALTGVSQSGPWLWPQPTAPEPGRQRSTLLPATCVHLLVPALFSYLENRPSTFTLCGRHRAPGQVSTHSRCPARSTRRFFHCPRKPPLGQLSQPVLRPQACWTRDLPGVEGALWDQGHIRCGLNILPDQGEGPLHPLSGQDNTRLPE